MRRTIGGLVAAALFAGCAGVPIARPTSNESSVDLLAARRAAGLPDCPATDPNVEPVPDGLPKTALDCLGGGSIVNLAGLPKRKMVINLWAQWCGPCREESAYLTGATAQLGSKVAFFGINYLDPQPGLAIEFAGLVGWTYPHIADPERSLQAPLRLAGIPTTLFVDETGRIVYRHVGPVDSTAQLVGLVAEHLGVS